MRVVPVVNELGRRAYVVKKRFSYFVAYNRLGDPTFRGLREAEKYDTSEAAFRVVDSLKRWKDAERQEKMASRWHRV